MPRPPHDTPISARDVNVDQLNELVAAGCCKSYGDLYNTLRDAASTALAEGAVATSRILWSFADACSMRFDNNDDRRPRDPALAIGAQQSATPETFNKDELDCFASLVFDLDNDWLRARIADLLWLMGKPKRVEYALKAVTAYRAISSAGGAAAHDVIECWDRGTRLAASLGESGKSELDLFRKHLISALQDERISMRFQAVWLSEALKHCRLDISDATIVRERLRALAKAPDALAYPRLSRSLFRAASAWVAGPDRASLRAELLVEEIKSLMNEGDLLRDGGADNAHAAMSCYEQALSMVLELSKRDRQTFGIDALHEQLARLVRSEGATAVSNLSTTMTHEIDIGDLIEHSQSLVSGKPLEDALLGLAAVSSIPSVEHLRSQALTNQATFPLKGLFASVHLSSDGRVTARGAASSGALDSTQPNEYTTSLMHEHYQLRIGIAVAGAIRPALHMIRLEHRVRWRDIEGIVETSPIFPSARVSILTKGLICGFENDFVTASHLLVPQIEHMVRVQLQQQRVVTTVRTDGVDNEIGLSALLDRPQATASLGTDLAFCLQALLTDARGPNLRNNIAHGLFQPCRSSLDACAYLWWLTWHLATVQLRHLPDASVNESKQ